MHLPHKSGRRKKSKARSRYIILLDKLTFAVGVIGPLTVLPQIYTIFTARSASGVSLVTWSLIFLMTLPWTLYGIAHKDRAILTCFALWGAMDLIVVVGVLLYG